MGQISSWIISVCGIVLVGVVVDVILPQKKGFHIVKTVIAIATMLIIIKPVAKIDFSNFNLNSLFSSVSVDNNFVDLRNEEKIKALSSSIQLSLDKNGYKNVAISFDLDSEKMLINTVFVDLSKLVLSDKNLNINKYTNIVAIVQQFVNINQGQVVFNEWRKKDKQVVFRHIF